MRFHFWLHEKQREHYGPGLQYLIGVQSMLQYALVVLLSLISLVSCDGLIDKVANDCKPCNAPCRATCSNDLKLQSANMFVGSICTAVESDDYALLQTIITLRSTIEYVFVTETGCQYKGPMPYLNGMIELLPQLDCPMPPTVLSSYIDSKGNVVVNTSEYVVYNGQSTSVKGRYIFSYTPECQASIESVLLRQVECV